MTTRLSATECASLEALLDAIGMSRTAPDDDAAAEAVLSAGMLFLAEIAKEPIFRALVQQGRATAPIDKKGKRDDGAFIAGVLARLVTGSTPLLRTIDNFPVEVVIRDLLEAAKPNGSSPLALPAAKRKRGKRDHSDLKRAAQLRIVLAVYHEAGRTTMSVSKVRNGQGLDLDKNRSSWQRWQDATTLAERNEAKRQGAKATVQHADLAQINWDRLVMTASRP